MLKDLNLLPVCFWVKTADVDVEPPMNVTFECGI